MLRLFVMSCLAIAALSGAAMAAPLTYTCALDVARANNWVPSQLVIQHDADTGRVIVNDPIIIAMVGQPVEGKVDIDNAKRVTFLWELPKVKNRSGQFTPRFLYRATFIRATEAVSVLAKPAGFPNSFEGRGKCTVSNG
jgi:hypothetical protein